MDKAGSRAPVRERAAVVIPCYNEAARLRTDAFASFLESSAGAGIDLFFVNDGSTDATVSVLHALRSRFPDRVHVFDKQPNAGKAEAVRYGMLAAMAAGGYAVTGFWDADLATPLEQIPDLAAVLLGTPGLAMVFGARVRLLGRHIYRQRARHYLGRCFATAASRVLRMQIYDTQCGAKLFRITPELGAVLAEPFLSRWIFDVELLARFLARHGNDPAPLREMIYEYPLPRWADVAGSKVHPLDFFKAFNELLQIHRHYRRR